MKKFKLGLIGAGNMGRNYIRVLEKMPAVERLAVYDPSPAWQNAQPHGDKIKTAKSAAELVAESEAVVIASSTATHFEMTKLCLDAGKHVLVEKPITHKLSEAKELVQLHGEKSRGRAALVFGVGHIERFNPVVRCALRSVGSGLIGEPVHAAFKRIGGYPRSAVVENDVVIDLAVHDVDLSRLFVFKNGKEPKLAGSHVQRVRNPAIADVADILLKSPEGRSASVHVNWLTPFRSRGFWVVGTEGYLEVDLIKQAATVRKSDLLLDFAKSEKLQSWENLSSLSRVCDVIELGVQPEEPLKIELETFLECVAEGKAFPVSPSDGTLALELTLGALS